MLVDLGRNDVGRVSKPGTVVVEKLMEIERYSHVMHISSTVTGSLLDELGPFDVLRAALPAGTVSGGGLTLLHMSARPDSFWSVSRSVSSCDEL